jgi:hypothetical protein
MPSVSSCCLPPITYLLDPCHRVAFSFHRHVLPDSALCARCDVPRAAKASPQTLRSQGCRQVIPVIRSALINTLLVFLTFWQATVLSGLSLLGIVKDVRSSHLGGFISHIPFRQHT